MTDRTEAMTAVGAAATGAGDCGQGDCAGGRRGGKKTFAVDIDGTVTVDGAGGTIHLDAMLALRHLAGRGHNVVFVTGRSSVEAYLLSVFGGTTRVAVGENGGCITTGDDRHVLLGDMGECARALEAIRSEIGGCVRQKPVFPRMTEVVMERTFDLDAARDVVSARGLDVVLADSQYAYHINSRGVDKALGFARVMDMLSVDPSDVVAMGDSETDVPLFRLAGTSVAMGNAPDDVRGEATMAVSGRSGDGVLEALNLLAARSFEVAG